MEHPGPPQGGAATGRLNQPNLEAAKGGAAPKNDGISAEPMTATATATIAVAATSAAKASTPVPSSGHPAGRQEVVSRELAEQEQRRALRRRPLPALLPHRR